MNDDDQGHILENKVVSITGRRSKNDNDADEPVLKETSQRSVEGAVAGPEAGEGQDTLTAKLLHKTTLREDDTENVSKGRQSDKDGQGTLSSVTHDVAEQRGSDETLRGDNLGLGDGGKVGNVGEDVQDRDGDDGDGSSNLEGALRVSGLAQGVVGVAVTDETPNDVVQGGNDTISAGLWAVKGIVEVVGLLIKLDVSTEGDKAGNDDDQDDDDLDYAQDVLKTKTPLESSAMDDKGDSDTGQTDTTLVPTVDLLVGGVEDVLAKDDRVSRGPTHEDDIKGVHGGDQELGLAVDVLEVVLFTSVLGDTGTPFEVDGRTGSGDDGADDPHEESQADTAGQGEDGRRSRKDTGTDAAVKDEHGGAQDADLALVVAGMLKTAWTS
jgi:hypothetical protein